jgi:L-iditol 2-dehydrogenase
MLSKESVKCVKSVVRKQTMADTMKAIMYYAPKDVRVEMIPVPACGDNEIRVKVDACAVCGTDLKSYNNGNPRIKAPLPMGHEFTGLVETIGKHVEGFTLGDRIVMATTISCGECYYCQRGWQNICANLSPMSFGYAGGMAEYTVIPSRALRNGHVIKVPEGVNAEHAALSEPVSCAVNTCEICEVRNGDTVVISGAGTLGMMNACVAREFGAQKIILVNRSKPRLERARSFGFDVLIHSEEQDVLQTILDETNGIGADVVIVAAPAAAPQEQAIELVRKRGAVCLFASLPVGRNMLSLDSRKIHYGELRVLGISDSTPHHVAKAVELISQNRLPMEKLATHILGLDDIFKAFELMTSGKSLRVVLKP